jgi:hypothetical protein
LKLNWIPAFLAVVPLSGLANAETLYTIQENTDSLCTIDTVSGVLTVIGPLGISTNFGDLAWDSSTGTLYLSNGWGSSPSELYTINTSTGAATLVGSMGANDIFGLAYDPVSNKLYGSASTSSFGLYQINKTTGAATLIGNPGVGLDSIAWVGSTSSLVGVYAGPSTFHTLDTTNGTETQLAASSGFINNCGMTWVPSSNALYVVDWSGNFLAFDVANGLARTQVGSGYGSLDGLAFAGSGSFCAPPVAYCTPSTSGNGCVAQVASSGTPSASATSGFQISVSGLEGQRSTLFFYSTNGQLIQQWAIGSSSYLCVRAPTQRTFSASSGGTAGQCNGAHQLDWLAFMSANPTALGNPARRRPDLRRPVLVPRPAGPQVDEPLGRAALDRLPLIDSRARASASLHAGPSTLAEWAARLRWRTEGNQGGEEGSKRSEAKRGREREPARQPLAFLSSLRRRIRAPGPSAPASTPPPPGSFRLPLSSFFSPTASFS